MFVPFESLAGSSRVWIYQSDRKLSATEKDILSNALLAFTEQWQVHGQPMKASFTIYYNQFVILAADEDHNAASGCSIDGSVRALKEFGHQLTVDFFNRNLVAFKKEEEIIIVSLSELKKKNAEGIWNENTLFFNNLVPSVETLKKNWTVPAGSTWLKRYLSEEKVTH